MTGSGRGNDRNQRSQTPGLHVQQGAARQLEVEPAVGQCTITARSLLTAWEAMLELCQDWLLRGGGHLLWVY